MKACTCPVLCGSHSNFSAFCKWIPTRWSGVVLRTLSGASLVTKAGTSSHRESGFSHIADMAGWPRMLDIYIYLSIHSSTYVSICLGTCVPIYKSIQPPSIYLSICLSMYVDVCACMYVSTYLPTYPSIHQSIYPSSIYLPIYDCLSVYLPIFFISFTFPFL